MEKIKKRCQYEQINGHKEKYKELKEAKQNKGMTLGTRTEKKVIMYLIIKS